MNFKSVIFLQELILKTRWCKIIFVFSKFIIWATNTLGGQNVVLTLLGKPPDPMPVFHTEIKSDQKLILNDNNSSIVEVSYHFQLDHEKWPWLFLPTKLQKNIPPQIMEFSLKKETFSSQHMHIHNGWHLRGFSSKPPWFYVEMLILWFRTRIMTGGRSEKICWIRCSKTKGGMLR